MKINSEEKSFNMNELRGLDNVLFDKVNDARKKSNKQKDVCSLFLQEKWNKVCALNGAQ